eukprot:PhF_6_TR36368/c0_g1_i8/m.53419/K17086/TM9SF2_4; transmembrane 9 superfamily member 2/4
MASASLAVLLVVVALAITFFPHDVEATWFYLPGIEPISYKRNQTVYIKVNTLRSLNALPYSYYYLPFCRPDKSILDAGRKAESLGEVLWGDDIEVSYYTVNMLVDEPCKKVQCTPAELKSTPEKMSAFEKFIEDEYRGHMVLDNLPVFTNLSWTYQGRCQGDQTFEDFGGYAIGVKKTCSG